MSQNSLLIRFPPIVQGGVSFSLGIVAIILAHFLFPGNSWEFIGVFFASFFYIFINCIVSVFQPSFYSYNLPSWVIYIIIMLVLLQAARRFSGDSIWKHSEYQSMVLVLTGFYFILTIVTRILRAIYIFLSEE